MRAEAADTQQAKSIGLRGTVRFVDGSLFLSATNERGNVVTVLFGGNDGVLITIDGQGHIHVLPPEGPGDPEIRQAVTAALQTINLLGAAAGTNLASQYQRIASEGGGSQLGRIP